MVTEVEQPEATQAEQPAGGGQPLDQAVQEQIARAVRPILGELEQRITQTVRQQMEQAQLDGLQGDEQQQEGPVQGLSNMLAALLQTVRSMVQAMVSLLRTVVRALQEALMAAVQAVMQALTSVVQQLGEILRQALASVSQQLGEILRPMLLEALHRLVQPLLQSAAERGVAAVLKTLESTLQGRTQAQPAPARAEVAATSAAR